MNLASDWLRAESSPVDKEGKKMDDGIARYFTRFGGNLCVCCGRRSLVSGTQNDIVVS